MASRRPGTLKTSWDSPNLSRYSLLFCKKHYRSQGQQKRKYQEMYTKVCYIDTGVLF
jgi:hypothetical protein